MTDAVRTGKWIGGLYRDTPCVVAARRVLRKRMRSVDRLIEPAAQSYADDPEYVHQLRVAARRSVSALQAFRPLFPDKIFRKIRRRLNRIRRRAGAARRIDVQIHLMKAECARSDGSSVLACQTLLSLLEVDRAAAQKDIVREAKKHRPLSPRKRLFKFIRRRSQDGRNDELPAPYILSGLSAQHLPGVLERVTAFRGQDLSDPVTMHGLRVAAKKLRYALEIFAGCYPAALKAEQYVAVEQMLDRLGDLNDLNELAEYGQRVATQVGLTHEADPSSNGNGRASETALSETARRFRERFHVRQHEFAQWWESPAACDLFDALKATIEAPVPIAAATDRPSGASSHSTEAGESTTPAHRRVAAIDVGSNSIRLVVGETDPLTKYRIIEDIKETTRLGGGVFDDGRISDSAMEASIRAIERMKEVALACRVDRVRAVATSAVREAINREEFLDRIERRTGVRLEVIDPEHEARLAFSSVANTFELDDRRIAVADIGGGSTELILSSGGVIDHVHPLPLGAVRLTERFGGADGRERFEDMRRAIDNVIHERLGGTTYRPYLIVGTGGTFTSLARVAIRHGTSGVGTGRFPFAVRGYELRHSEVMYFLESLRRVPLDERKKVAGLSGQRAEIIVAGVCIIERLMQHFGVDRMRVHDGGIRDGLLAEMIDDLGFRADPPRRHPPTSLDEVRKFAARSRYDQAHSEQVTRLALQIFDQLIEYNPDAVGTWGHGEARHLLQAAGILHDVGIAVSYDRHHRHSYDMVVHAELPGYTRREVEIMANLCRYHRRRGPSKRHGCFAVLGDDDQRLVTHLTGILRVADGLDRAHMQDVLDVRVTPTTRGTIFDVIAYVEPQENLRAAKKKADVFEKAFGTTARFVFTPQKDAPPAAAVPEEVEAIA